jgi:4a-hydroxytetrahydrobiopterin dehydratase
MPDAMALVQQVAPSTAADIDLRPPGTVHVTVRHDDVGAAERISAQARDLGLRSESVAAMATEVAIDAMDIGAVRPFWRAVLGYVDDGDDALADPDRVGPAFWFQQMDVPRTERNRVHIDVNVPHDVADERIAAALSAGGTLVSDLEAKAFWVLADPEGNEACICTWQDRG